MLVGHCILYIRQKKVEKNVTIKAQMPILKLTALILDIMKTPWIQHIGIIRIDWNGENSRHLMMNISRSCDTGLPH